MAGSRNSVDEFLKSVPGTTAKDAMNLVLTTQYVDTLKEIGASSRTNTILVPQTALVIDICPAPAGIAFVSTGTH